jgi:UDP-N-acetylmuramate dehydrogenase
MIFDRVIGRVEQNFPLKALNTWKVGGIAETVFWPESEEELLRIGLQARKEKLAIRLFGRGSNILFPDEGLSGITIISTALDKITWNQERVQVGAGYPLARLSQEAGKRGMTGLEFARGIPGTVGGAIVMNAGAHGGEIQDVLEQVKILTREGKIEILSKEDIEFGYRECSLRGKAWILEAILRLKYGDIEKIQSVMQANLAKRKSAQPLDLPNAGSVFRNPPGDSAGRLIEQAGWKGKGIGGAQVSTKHANFIVNTGCATAQDVLSLIQEIQDDVYQKYGVELKTEIQYIAPD